MSGTTHGTERVSEAPTVGINAHHPGNALPELMKAYPAMIRSNPETELACLMDEGMTVCRCSSRQTSAPISNSQNLVCG